MAIKIPERNYLTFAELALRWQCTELDVQHLIMRAELKPSYFIRADTVYRVPRFRDDGAVLLEEVDEEIRYFNAGFFYLHDPEQTFHLDCKFGCFSPLQFAPRLKDAKKNDLYFLDTSIEMTEVLKNGVVMMEELAFVEKKMAAPMECLPTEKPLATTERNTLLTIIAVLCKEANLDHTKHAKTAGLIQSTAAGMGLAVGETTIEGHLKKIPNALAGRMK